MLELGKKQTLQVVNQQTFGIYLAEKAEAEKEERILLPVRQVPENIQIGDSLEVFLYKDSEDRMIATTAEPKITLGKTALLKVKQVTRIGAFLDWGLDKDLLLPFHEQTVRVSEESEVLVALYIDKSSRLCATMKVYPYLKTNPPYAIGDIVEGRVYEVTKNFGVFIAVDDTYSALIPKREAQGNYVPGTVLKVRVTEVKEDGKLTVSAREKAYLQIGSDADRISTAIEQNQGVLPFDDKASPEKIMKEFGISKAAFKRAVGHLLKEKKILLRDGKIFRAENKEEA